jgi:hypothetical protein
LTSNLNESCTEYIGNIAPPRKPGRAQRGRCIFPAIQEKLMSLRGSVLALALFGVSTRVAAAEPQPAAAGENACFADHTVTKVVPHHKAIPSGQGSYQALAGARAYVPAKPGLTGEWLHAQLERRSSTPRQGTECPLDVPGVSIDVRSSGPGFWVSLSASDVTDAKEVLRRAQTLTR